MFALYDEDHDDQLSAEEFQKLYCVEIEGEEDNSCDEANSVFEPYAGGDGSITEEEFNLVWLFFL
jgi:Ca2+-binding EF-hand superfamily protein